MTINEKAAWKEKMSPHLRQRIAFIAALVVEPDNVNWSAISDTYDDLSQEPQDPAVEKLVGVLRAPIQHQDAQALVRAIHLLLGPDMSPELGGAGEAHPKSKKA